MEAYDKIIKYIKNTVPFFSGARSPTLAADVRQFTTCCNLVYEKLSEEERPVFMQLVKIKFSGDAADLINNNNPADMAQLVELLTKTYVPKKTLQTLNDEIKRAAQRPGEKIREFGNRVEKLMQTCITEAKMEYAEGNAGLLQLIERDAVRAFKQGLINNAIKYQIIAIKKDKLTDIIKLAEEVQEESGDDLANFVLAPAAGDAARSSNSTNGRQQQNYGRSYQNVPPPNNYLNTENRWNNNRNNNQSNRNNSAPNSTQNGQANVARRCYKCGRMGHFQSDCRTRSENIFCTTCMDTHLACAGNSDQTWQQLKKKPAHFAKGPTITWNSASINATTKINSANRSKRETTQRDPWTR